MSKQPLVPQEEVIKIGERSFIQKPFGLDRTARLFGIMSMLLRRAREYPEIFTLMNEFGRAPEKEEGESDEAYEARKKEHEESSLRTMAQLLEAIFMILPDSMLDLVMLCLDIHNDKEAQDFVKENGTPSQMMDIVGTMVEQNDMKKIYEDFLALQAKLTRTFRKK